MKTTMKKQVSSLLLKTLSIALVLCFTTPLSLHAFNLNYTLIEDCQDGFIPMNDPTPEEEVSNLKKEVEELKERLKQLIDQKTELENISKDIIGSGDHITAEGFGIKFGRYLDKEAAIAKYKAITARVTSRQELKTERLRIRLAANQWGKMVEEQQATTNNLINAIKDRLKFLDRRVGQVYDNYKDHQNIEIYRIDMQEVREEKALAYQVYEKIPDILTDMNNTVRVFAGERYVEKKLEETVD